MAPRCAGCGSSDTEAGFDTFKCMVCGTETDYHGFAQPPKPQFSAPNHQEKRAAGEVDRGI